MKKVPGGWSSLTKEILRGMFLKDKISTTGIQLSVNGGVHVRVFFWALLADEEALAAMWGTTGASGTCPCGIICSVTNKPIHTDVARGIPSLAAIDTKIPDISCGEESKLGLRTDQYVWNMCDELEAAPAGQRAELQQFSGIKYHPDALLYDRALRQFVSPTASNRFDVMHVVASNGVLGVEMALLLGEMKGSLGAYFAEVRAFHIEEGWQPKTEIFSKVREKSCEGSLKAGASELWSAYPLLRRFVLVAYGEDAPEPHVQSFMLLCDIVDIFVDVMHGGGVEAAANLRSLVLRYLKMFVTAHGHHHLKWKHHALVHLYNQILKDGCLLSCWVVERKNIAGKESMANCRSKKQIESTALSRMLNAQVRKLEAPGWASRLEKPCRSLPQLAATINAMQVEVSAAMKWCGISIKNGDILFLDSDRARLVVVVGCLAVDSGWGLLVRAGAPLSRDRHASKWTIAADVSYHILGADRILKAAFHRYVAPQCLEVLH